MSHRQTDEWPLIAVFDGTVCLGFVYARRHQFEAFDANDVSLGLFDSREAARQAVIAARRAT
jgi:hypothetical protein